MIERPTPQVNNVSDAANDSLAEIYDLGMVDFDEDPALFEGFMATPHRSFDGKTPNDLLQEGRFDEVEGALAQIFGGEWV